jgi:hypothetical protein
VVLGARGGLHHRPKATVAPDHPQARQERARREQQEAPVFQRCGHVVLLQLRCDDVSLFYCTKTKPEMHRRLSRKRTHEACSTTAELPRVRIHARRIKPRRDSEERESKRLTKMLNQRYEQRKKNNVVRPFLRHWFCARGNRKQGTRRGERKTSCSTSQSSTAAPNRRRRQQQTGTALDEESGERKAGTEGGASTQQSGTDRRAARSALHASRRSPHDPEHLASTTDRCRVRTSGGVRCPRQNMRMALAGPPQQRTSSNSLTHGTNVTPPIVFATIDHEAAVCA